MHEKRPTFQCVITFLSHFQDKHNSFGAVHKPGYGGVSARVERKATSWRKTAVSVILFTFLSREALAQAGGKIWQALLEMKNDKTNNHIKYIKINIFKQIIY
ncbi:MAG: hypothetical protein IJN87_09985 [Firmicutes bacterium]|nr:hypothetical protein [Bacillota bacterium]